MYYPGNYGRGGGSMSLKHVGCVVTLVVLALLPVSAPAQQTLGSINGTVTDASGGVIANADVKIRNVNTNLELSAQTKDDGSFLVADLPIGTYEVVFSRTGSKSLVYSAIIVQGNQTSTVNRPASARRGDYPQVTVNATPFEPDRHNQWLHVESGSDSEHSSWDRQLHAACDLESRCKR